MGHQQEKQQQVQPNSTTDGQVANLRSLLELMTHANAVGALETLRTAFPRATLERGPAPFAERHIPHR